MFLQALNTSRALLVFSTPVCIALARQLGLPHERLRRVKRGHHHLDELDLLRARKSLVFKQIVQLALVRDRVTLRFDASVIVERTEDIRPLPIRDVVVFAVLSVDVALDRVPAVVEHEDDGFQPEADHGRDLLHC